MKNEKGYILAKANYWILFPPAKAGGNSKAGGDSNELPQA